MLFAKLIIPSPSTNTGRVEDRLSVPLRRRTWESWLLRIKRNPWMCIWGPKPRTASKAVWPVEDMILLLYSCLTRLHLECCVQVWGSQSNKSLDLLEWVQRRPWGCSEDGPPLPWRLAETVKVVLPGEQKGSERPYSTLQYLKGLQEIWRGTLARACSDETKPNNFKWKRVGLN